MLGMHIKILLALLIMAVSGCTPKPAGSAAGEYKEPVTFSVIYASGDFLTTSLKHAVIEDYQSLNPHITIIEKLTGDLRLLDAVGEFPELMEFRHSPTYIEIGKIGELPQDIIDLFETTPSFEGKVYVAPFAKGYTTGIVYSRKIFRELGINADDIITYNDFLDVCEKIKNAGIAPIVVGGADVWHMGYWWGYFWQREIGIKNPDWLAHRYEGKVKFTDPDVRSALAGLHELFSAGYIERNWPSTAEAQCPGILVGAQAAMYYIGQFVFQQIEEIDKEFEFGFFALPDKEGKINLVSPPSETGWAISAEAQQDPAKAEAIYDFIRYFFSKDVYINYISRTNSMPLLKEKFDYPVNEQFREVMNAIEKADNEQPNWNQREKPNLLPEGFRNYCYRLVTQWFMNSHSIDGVLAAMDREWDRLAVQ